MEPQDRLIFALDVPSRDEALRLADRLEGHVGCLKVGLELFVSCGPQLVTELQSRLPVMLDLKLHDIPATVGRATRACANLRPAYLTVHIDDGGRALAAAVDLSERTLILGITVLTSITDEDVSSAGYCLGAYCLGVASLVKRRAQLAQTKGCRGLVCSGQEVQGLRELLGPSMLLVVPGIRPSGQAEADQKRVVTPKEAIARGADKIVVGRPIRDAQDPAEAADRIVAELASA